MYIEPPYTAEKLAKRWGCSSAVIRKLCRENKLGHFRVGDLIRIPHAAVEAFESTPAVPKMGVEVGQGRKARAAVSGKASGRA